MTRKAFFRLVLALVCCLLTALAVSVWEPDKIRTDVFSLIGDAGTGQDSAIIQDIIASQARVVALRIDGPDAAARAHEAAKWLGSAPGFSSAVAMEGNAFAAAGAALYEERMVLLFPRHLHRARVEWTASGAGEDFEQWLAGREVARLDAFLQSPESLALADLVPSDPLLLLPEALNAPGLPVGSGMAEGSAVVLAETSGAATDAATQTAVLASVAELQRSISAEGCTLSATGAVFFAERSERDIRADVLRLNLLMTGLLLALALAILRSLWTLASLALPVALAWLGAIGVLLAVFPSVYALALGIGGILGGIALDYPVHLALHRHAGEPDHRAAFRRVRGPLLIGCLSTVLVFAFLLFSGLPLVRQVGMLVGAGLLFCGAISLPALEAFPPPMDAARVSARIDSLRVPASRRLRGIVGLALLACMAGLPLLHWGNAIDDLQVPMSDLFEADAHVREAAGSLETGTLFAACGGDLSAALEASEGAGEGLSGLLATPSMLDEAVRWYETDMGLFEFSFSAALEQAGYDSMAFAPLLAAFPSASQAPARMEAALERLRGALPPGLGWMMGRSDGGAWVCGRIPAGSGEIVLPAGVHLLDTRARLREAFDQYRVGTAQLALAGVLAAALLIVLLNGVRNGLRILAIPLLSTGATLGVLGLCGAELNLFHVVGLLLGFGLTLDYALFTVEGHTGKASVRLSALTTFCAFAALTTSMLPAVRGLGLSVVLMIVFTLLQCELHANDEAA